MEEVTLQVQRDEESGWLVASWDAPGDAGGITTQGEDLRDLQQQITDAVSAHFEEGERRRRIRVHFVSDPILAAV
jgi:predicted RNase H-like HicB family nuclease